MVDKKAKGKANDAELESDRNDDEWEDCLDTEDVLELAGQTNALLCTLMCHPQLNSTNPRLSPQPLFQTADFVRRTYLEYIMPLLPKDAAYKTRGVANPFVFDYRERQFPTADDEDYLDDPANWPELDDALMEKYNDAVGRNSMICLSIMQPVPSFNLARGGDFDFGENVREVAGMILGGEEAEAKVRAKYLAEGIDLAAAVSQDT